MLEQKFESLLSEPLKGYINFKAYGEAMIEKQGESFIENGGIVRDKLRR